MTLEKKCVNASHRTTEFWAVALETQVREFEEAVLEGDMDHALEELVDAALVSADAIRHLKPKDSEKDFWSIMTDRVVDNARKSGVYDRDMVFYSAKLEKLKVRIAELRAAKAWAEARAKFGVERPPCYVCTLGKCDC